jgi:hypothetical protein
VNVADDGHQRLWVHQLFERNVFQIQLSRARNHHTVEPLFDERPIGPHAELTAEHHVERVRPGAAHFVAKLHPVDAPPPASLPGELFFDELGKHLAEVHLRDIDVAVIVAPDSLQVILRQVLGEPFGHDDDAVLLAFPLLADAHRLDDSLDQCVNIDDWTI